MRLRDRLIVLLAIIAIIFGWSQEGTVVIKRGFYVQVNDQDAAVHQMPAPIVTDIDGDGKPDTLVLQSRTTLGLFPTSRVRRVYDNVFMPPVSKASATLIAPVIGVAAGHVTYYDPKKATAGKKLRRRQHIAVVTDDYRVSMYDHKLNEVWSIPLLSLAEATIIPYHATINLMPERVFDTDVGSVIVSVAVGGPNSTERMAYFALNGGTGEIRWKRTIDEYDELNSLHSNAARIFRYDRIDKLVLSEKDLMEHTNERDWFHFRESIVAALPHEYSHPWHNRVDAHHFTHPKGRKKREKSHVVGKRHDVAPVRDKYRHVHAEVDDVGELGEHFHMLQKGGHKPDGSHRMHPNVIIHHGKEGLQVLHLYTGKPITRLGPLKRRVAYHDINDDFEIDEVAVEVGAYQEHHHRHGMIEEIRCNGAITTGIPLSNTRVYNATVCDTEGLLSSMSLLTHFVRGDGQEDTPQADALSLIGSRNIASKMTKAAPPLVVQHHVSVGPNMWKTRRRAVFMIDSGLLTCLNPVSKSVLWRTQTDASFTITDEGEDSSGGLHSKEEADNRVKSFPHLAPYAFHAHNPAVRSSRTMHYSTDPYVLAVGDKYLTAVNARNGHVSRTESLLSPPIAPTIVADFNGDGTNDIIVTTNGGYYGYTVQRQNAGSTTSILILMAIAVLVILYSAQRLLQEDEFDEGYSEAVPTKVPVAKRSTD